jgi:cytochrome c-type biogenesis protein CcmH
VRVKDNVELPMLQRIYVTSILCILLFSNAFCLTEVEIEANSQDIFAEINSPFCKGRLLRDCPSTGATQLKGEIREMVSAGKGKKEIIASLFEKFGEDEIRALPSQNISGWIGWLAPFAFLGVGALLVVLWVRKNQPGST